MNKIEKKVLIEFPLNAFSPNVVSGEAMYFRNLNWLNSKTITNIRTYSNLQYNSSNITVVTRFEMRQLTLTMLLENNFKPINNLPVRRLCTDFGPASPLQSKYPGLPITGKFFFDKCYVTILGTSSLVLQAKYLPIEFTYID